MIYFLKSLDKREQESRQDNFWATISHPGGRFMGRRKEITGL
jgi:hypothetical protein